MKKRITVVLYVETNDEIMISDEFILNDLEREINCASNFYDVESITIEDLPSAQPEMANQTEESAQNVQNEDLISRKVAIDTVEESRRLNHHQNGKEACAHEYEHRHFLKILMELPPAEPKRVKGRWIEMLSYMNHTYKCSECGRLLVNITDGKNNVSNHYPYCHCGADMRGEQDG